MESPEIKCERRKKSFYQILLTVIIVLAVIIIIYYCSKTIFFYVLTKRLSLIVHKMCTESTMQYRKALKYPESLIPKFDYDIATALWDLGGVVGDAHCRDSIPLPPPCDRYFILYGDHLEKSPDGGKRKIKVGYIFWDESQNWAAIIFSGTHYQSQWINNLRTTQTKIDFIKNEVSYKRTNNNQTVYKDGTPSLIHSGFYEDYISVREQIYAWLEGEGSNLRKIIISGRSLGGALSTVCAYDLSYKGNLNIVHYSFASPRVGNPVFANRFNQQVPYSIRVYNNSDHVCDLPFSVFGNEIYEHVGTPETDYGFSINTGSIVKNHIDAYSDLRF